MINTNKLEEQVETRLLDFEISCVAQIVSSPATVAPRLFVVLLDVPRTQCARACAEAYAFILWNTALTYDQVSIQVVPE